MFGISRSVRSREVQVCTPELFHRAIKGSKVSLICAEIEDALEKLRRGELKKEEYERMKTQLKSQLPILTPHATFKNGRRLNADAIPSGLSIYDKDHIPNPRGYWEEKQKILAQKSVLDSICLVHVTPSTEGLRLIFKIPKGMTLAEAQKWMSETVHLSNGIVFKASGTTILKSIVFQSHPNTFLAHWMNLVCVLSLGMKRYRLNTLHTINQCTILSSPLSLLAKVIRPKARFTSSIFKAVLNNSESNGLSE